MKVKYDIFVPEKGGINDIVFEKYEHDWKDRRIEIFPFPLSLDLIEMHVDESGRYKYKDFNMLGFCFIVDIAGALKDQKHKMVLDSWVVNLLGMYPYGPIGIIVPNKKILEELKEYFLEKKKHESLYYGRSDDSTDTFEEGSTPDTAIVISESEDENEKHDEDEKSAAAEAEHHVDIKKSKNEKI